MFLTDINVYWIETDVGIPVSSSTYQWNLQWKRWFAISRVIVTCTSFPSYFTISTSRGISYLLPVFTYHLLWVTDCDKEMFWKTSCKILQKHLTASDIFWTAVRSLRGVKSRMDFVNRIYSAAETELEEVWSLNREKLTRLCPLVSLEEGI